jgi:hypothetical protein
MSDKAAEDRALAEWQDAPWPDGIHPWGDLETSVARTQRNFTQAFEHAFRAGFRAGQDAGHLQGIDKLESEPWRNYIRVLNARIDKLEQHPERLGSSEKHIDRRVEDCEDRLAAIEKAPYIDDRIIEHDKRLTALETRPEPDHRGRFMGIERRLEMIEQWLDAIRKAGA